MKKLAFSELVQMLEIYNNGYCDFNNTKIKHNDKIYSGEIFRLCNKLTKEQRAIFELFPNVLIGNRTMTQCPEFQANCIFLSDTKFVEV